MQELVLHLLFLEEIKRWRRAWLCCLVAIPCALSFVYAQDTASLYARLLNTIPQASEADRLLMLQRFAEHHPHHVPAFLKMLERFLVQQSIAEADAYFQSLASRSIPHRRNSLWMLAKLAVFEKNSPAAQGYFVAALQDDIFSQTLALLHDYFEFRHQQIGILDVASELIMLRLNRVQQQAARSFMLYQNEDYARAQAAFRRTASMIVPDECLLEYWGESAYRNEHLQLAKRLALADSIWRSGLAVARNNDNVTWQARFFAKRATVAQRRREYGQALALCDSGYTMARKSDDVAAVPELLSVMGNLAYLNDDYLRADSLYDEAIQLAERMRASKTLAGLYLDRSQPLYELSEYQPALNALALSEVHARAIRDEETLIHVKLRRARIYLAFGRSEAEGIVRQALAQARIRRYQELAYRAEVLWADIMHSRGRQDSARVLYQEFLAYLDRADNRFEYHNYVAKIADTYKYEGQQDSARVWYGKAAREAEKINAERFHLWYLIELIQLDLMAENYQSAIERLLVIYPRAVQINDAGLQQSISTGLGIAHKNLQNYRHACYWYRRAAEVIEKTRNSLKTEVLRLGYFEDRSLVYQELMECYYYLYQNENHASALDSVFCFMQMSQARTLHEALSDKRLVQSGTPEATYRPFQHACMALRVLQRKIRTGAKQDSLLEKWKAARQEVVIQRLRLLRSDTDIHTSAEVLPLGQQEVLAALEKEDAGLLLYHVGFNTSFAVVAARQNMHIVPLPTNFDVIDSLSYTLLEPLHEVERSSIANVRFYAGIAHKLYEQLVQPIEATVDLPKHLIIVPDLATSNLPFDMLLVNSPTQDHYLPSSKPEYASSFLLHRYDITYSPSVALLQENPSLQSRVAGVLVLANATAQAGREWAVLTSSQFRTGWNFSPLPYSEIEAERIKQVYSAADTFTRAAASKAMLFHEASKRRVLHLATHAFVDSVFDAFSGLVLATIEDSTDDGMLMGYEIADLQLECDLVALSACETGVGEHAQGEGVLGLPRLFLRAGAKSVLMTFWQVHDEFAAELMPKFYHFFLNKGLSKAEALAQSKRLLLQEKGKERGLYFQHPFFWSAFALYGDPGRDQPGIAARGTTVFIASVLLCLFALAWFFFSIKKKVRSRRAIRA